MTIYDELGLSSDATDEQIRQAHRQLVKVLHPDRQQDPELQRMADLQLKRINHLVEQILQNPRSTALVVTRPAPVTEPKPPAVARPAVWSRSLGSFGAVSVLAILALLLPEPELRSHTVSPSTGSAAGTVSGAERTQMSARGREAAGAGLRRNNTQNRAANATLSAGVTVEAPVASGSRTDAVPESQPTAFETVSAAVPSPAPQQAQMIAEKTSLDGVWLYAGDPGPGGFAKLYPPEYIELRLTQEADGTLRGEYRGRYSVADLAISPSVSFRFREKNPNLAAVPWTGSRGAAGMVSLQMVRPDVMEVTWKATSTATDAEGGAELSYGTATLIRRR
ncbi:hypothetical protein F183_A24840 [Bryobacterales bacterium F-183]|nr:hypothetical protein F183_A24840 [Bryobacterales bacterium F-183]